MNELLDLYWTFVKIGCVTFGGGYAMLPILEEELANKRNWTNLDELRDYFSIGQCTPGIIAVNTATLIGLEQKGTLGGIVATLGVVAPSVLIITIIALFLRSFAHLPVVAHAFAGIRACVCVLILNAVLKIWKTTVIDLPTAVIFAAVFLLSVLLGLSPALLVVVAGLIGLGLKRARGWEA